ncbi:MAG: orotidine-5'-phosphate decarboxylase [Anaerovoracaceae bacterium]|jgi:orotidine-5'-phosphate decarboxylase
MNGEPIIALDFPDRKTTINFLDKFEGRKPFVKIGMELFYAEGPQIVREIKERGHRIFLDLKLHDIPNTVKRAMASLAALDVDIVNVHAAGTVRMMSAALEGVTAEDGSRPLVIAVTQLTSTDEKTMNDELGIAGSMEDVVCRYARNAKEAGLDGVVCSPLESPVIHECCGDDFMTLTPGVRFAGDSAGDQKRVTTPETARELGSTFIVVGRSITGAADPVAAYERCLKEFGGQR